MGRVLFMSQLSKPFYPIISYLIDTSIDDGGE